MPRTRSSCCLLAGLLGLALLAGPAHAAPVTVVDGHHLLRESDPAVPPKSETYMRGRSVAPPATVSSNGSRAVAKALAAARRHGSISRASYVRYRRAYGHARSVRARLRGARRAQLGYVIGSIESIAARGRLIPSRMPSLFVQLERNTRYWPSLPFPASGDQLSFKGSELLYQYYPGRGLQLQPLSTFKKANNLHSACVKHTGPCRPAGIKRLLDEMTSLAVRRSSRFIAWEYMFSFDGGIPPWMSGMAQATAIQAYARASRLLGQPSYLTTARKALPAFQVHPPVGVRTTGFLGGVHYLQYSFAPRTYIFNAFLQSLIGLYDYSTITGDTLARRLFDQAEPEARREIPYSDTGSWSRYQYRGPRSTPPYHELLREFLQSMCDRRLGDVYCTYAARYRRYQATGP